MTVVSQLRNKFFRSYIQFDCNGAIKVVPYFPTLFLWINRYKQSKSSLDWRTRQLDLTPLVYTLYRRQIITISSWHGFNNTDCKFNFRQSNFTYNDISTVASSGLTLISGSYARSAAKRRYAVRSLSSLPTSWRRRLPTHDKEEVRFTGQTWAAHRKILAGQDHAVNTMSGPTLAICPIRGHTRWWNVSHLRVRMYPHWRWK